MIQALWILFQGQSSKKYPTNWTYELPQLVFAGPDPTPTAELWWEAEVMREEGVNKKGGRQDVQQEKHPLCGKT